MSECHACTHVGFMHDFTFENVYAGMHERMA